MEEQKPGEVIVPLRPDEPAAGRAAEIPAAPKMDVPAQSPLQPAPSEQGPDTSYYPDQNIPADTSQPVDGAITWEADEYLVHEKSARWYGLVAVCAVVIAGAVYFLNKDVLTASMVLVSLVGLAFFASRRPRRQQFVVAPEGVQVGRMFYPFADFRSFALSDEKIGRNLVLVSFKRFVPPVNVYIPEEFETMVVDMVASILPMEPHKPDLVERFVGKIHF